MERNEAVEVWNVSIGIIGDEKRRPNECISLKTLGDFNYITPEDAELIGMALIRLAGKAKDEQR